MNYYLGVDLGGTNLRTAVIDTTSGKVLIQRKCPTLSSEGQEAVTGRMIGLINEVITAASIPLTALGGIGIGVPGTPDMDQGSIVLLTNMPGQWRNFPLKSVIENAVHLPVALINDVRAMTLSEWKFGAGRGVDSLACIAIGTGIGGGIVLNGNLYLGIDGTAGEFGHQIVEVNGATCGCGSHGCLEMYASGPAIAAMGVKEVMHGHTTRIGELVNYDLNSITAEVVSRAAKLGDLPARQILSRAGSYLGIAISNMITILSPQKVIFGGGVAQAGELLLDSVRKTVNERVFVVPTQKIQFEQAALGSEAGLVGAALWARIRCEGG